jgi:hypothetical protein
MRSRWNAPISDAAIEQYRLALRDFPDHPEARQHLLDLSKASGLKLKEEQ